MRSLMPDQTVAMVLNQLGGGGAQRSALTTAGAWPSTRGACLLMSARGGTYAVSLPEQQHVSILAERWPRPDAILTLILRLRHEALAGRLDAMFTHSLGVALSVLTGRVLHLIPRMTTVVVQHNTLSAVLADRFPSRPVRALVRTLTRWLYRHADALIGVSDGVARDLEHTLDLPTGTVTTIHNPVDTDAIHTATHTPPPDELRSHFESLPRPIILTIGRLVPQKAHTDLIDAFAALPDHQRGTLVILGEGPLRTTLETRIHDLGLDQHTWLPGFVDNPWWFLARADLFALTSHYEGHPRSLLEALACRTPIVATDCPSGPREILHDLPGTTLVPVADIPAITHAITAHLTNPQRPDPDLTPHHPTTTAHHYERIILDRARQRPR